MRKPPEMDLGANPRLETRLEADLSRPFYWGWVACPFIRRVAIAITGM